MTEEEKIILNEIDKRLESMESSNIDDFLLGRKQELLRLKKFINDLIKGE